MLALLLLSFLIYICCACAKNRKARNNAEIELELELERAQAEGVELPDELKKIADKGKRRRSTKGPLSKIFSGREDFDEDDDEKIIEGKGK